MTLTAPIRYMGTKRQLAGHVRRVAAAANEDGAIADLFSGMGSVAAEHADRRPVVTNDAMPFTAALARARFTGKHEQPAAKTVASKLVPAFLQHQKRLQKEFAQELADERAAVAGSYVDLSGHFEAVKHAANSSAVRARALKAASSSGAGRYKLASLYYAGGYFSVSQALDLDALRFAIDTTPGLKIHRDWAMGSLLSAASRLINAPGHTAQFLKPNGASAASRIRAFWARPVWPTFESALAGLTQEGNRAWRGSNKVFVSDALDLLQGKRLAKAGVIYADPPYTKDQYSRFYHVYETLYAYDFPLISGIGRVRPPAERFSTNFCLSTGVVSAFTVLFGRVKALGVPLVLSYPSNGLLAAVGTSVEEVVDGKLTLRLHERYELSHSTMGGSQGSRSKQAMENLYVFSP